MDGKNNELIEASSFLCDKIRIPISLINTIYFDKITEIRIKKNGPVLIYTPQERFFLRSDGGQTDNLLDSDACIVSENDFDESVRRLCNYSVHTFQNQLVEGFVTEAGGHRVGVCASAVVNPDGKITAVKNITCLNIRISRSIPGAADGLIREAYGHGLKSVLIVGEPASGKTTVLRDAATRLAGKEFGFLKVSIIDERREIAALSLNGISNCCDIFDGYPKTQGMMAALRSMSPEIMICDEIGGDDDVVAIEKAANSGVKLLSTIHADSFEELLSRPQFSKLMCTCAFDIAVLLSGRHTPGTICETLSLKKYRR